MQEDYADDADKNQEFAELERVIAQSGIATVLTSIAMNVYRIAGASSAAAIVRRLHAELRMLDLSTRLRLTGLFVAAFAGGHALLLTLVPVQSAPAVPPAAFVLLGLAGLGLVAAADAFAIAWRHRGRHTKKL